MPQLLITARPEHRAALTQLLTEAALPTTDLPADLSGFVLAFNDDTLIGAAGLELFGTDALLRSVAVSPAYQGRGVARALLEQLRQRAARQGVTTLFLITTTADRYFAQLGFDRIARHYVPVAIAATQQFTTLCPASAVVMKQTLPQTEF